MLVSMATFFICLTCSGVSAEEGKDFFKGKTMKLIVPYSVGGGYDTYGRLAARYLAKYLQCTVIVKNITGAGGVVGINQLYSSKPNGLTLGLIPSGLFYGQIGKIKGVNYDLMKMDWLGRLSAENHIWVVGPKCPYKDFQSIKDAKNKFIIAMTGKGGEMYVTSALVASAVGLDWKVVTGYPGGSEINLAMIKGDVCGSTGGVNSKIPLIENGDAVPVFQMGKKRDPAISGIPLTTELTQLDEKGKKLMDASINLLETGRALALPPGVPSERVAYLRIVLDRAAADPAMQQDGIKVGRPLNYLPGKEMAEIVKQIFSMDEETRNLIAKNL